jgi:purine-binding chemotaxis protein CheW
METNSYQNKQTYLSFKLKNELFAVNVNKVLEVLERQYITTIPQTPAFLSGVINFLGEVLPVIDIRRKFNMKEREENDKYVIIVLDLNIQGNLKLGAIVDGVRDVMELNDAELKEIPSVGYNYKSDFITGMRHTAGGFMMILDFDRLFSEDEIKYLEETTAVN